MASETALLRVVTAGQAGLLVLCSLPLVVRPVHELRSYRTGVAHDPTTNLGPWIVPLLLIITALCLLAVAACVLLALALPLCARRLDRPAAYLTLVVLETVQWLVPLLLVGRAFPGAADAVAAVLLASGAVALGLLWAPSVRRRIVRLPSPRVAPHVPDPHRAPRPASGRRH